MTSIKHRSAYFVNVISFLFILGAASCSSEQPKTWTFQNTPSGSLPPYLKVVTGSWEIKKMNDFPSYGAYNALVQKGKQSGLNFNIAVVKEAVYKDLSLSVKFKVLAGEEDQGGGVMWRYQDASNYYLARVNPLEENFHLYKVIGGKRTKLASAPVKTSPDWNKIRIEMEKDHIRCIFDHKEVANIWDKTLPHGGGVGVWTKSDAQTAFNDLEVSEIK